MANLVVLGFDQEGTADKVRGVVERLVEQHVLQLADYVTVVRTADGKVHTNQAFNTTSAGAMGGAFWGLLVGMLFLNPVLGTAVGAAAGALGGRLVDIGVNDETVKRIGEALYPGTSALFLLVQQATADRVIEELRAYNPTVIQTSLSFDDEERLIKALAGASTDD